MKGKFLNLEIYNIINDNYMTKISNRNHFDHQDGKDFTKKVKFS